MSRDASLRTRGSRSYSFGEHGNSNVGERQGKHVIKNNQAHHQTCKWGEGQTTIRIFPQKNPEDTTGAEWDPYRFSSEGTLFGDWIRRYDAIRNFGDPGVTMIIQNQANDPVSQSSNPAWVLYNAIQAAVKAKQEGQGWASMLMGGQGRGAQLPKPSEIYLVQAAIMAHGTEVYRPPRGFGPEDRTHVVELSSNAGRALIAELVKPHPAPVAGVQEGDWEGMFANGDVVSLDHGRFVTFYKLSDGDPRLRQQQAASGQSWNAPAQQMGGQQQGAQNGWGCFIEAEFNGSTANMRQHEQVVASKVKPWDDLLWFPTVEEQAKMLADKFPPDVILYAWRDHPEWIPDAMLQQAQMQQQLTQPPQQQQQQWGGGATQQAPYQVQQAPPVEQGFGGPPQQPPPSAGQGFGTPPVQQAPPMLDPPQQLAPTAQQAPLQQTPTAPPAGFGAPPQQQAPPTQGFGAPPQQVQQPPQQVQQPQQQAQQPDVGGQWGNSVAPASGAPSGMPGGGVPPGMQPQAVPDAMGQTATGFASQGQAPPQMAQAVNQPPVNQPPAGPTGGPPQQGPAGGRAAAALAAAQAAVASPQ